MDPAAPPNESMVTSLFTDIEESTRLWEHAPDAMNEELARHDLLLHAVIKQHGGRAFKTIGDQFWAGPAAGGRAYLR